MEQFATLLNRPEVLIPFMLWSLVWKGLSLWKAASKQQLWWFIVLLTINTMTVVEIVYLVYLHRFDLDHGKTLAYLRQKETLWKKKRKLVK